MLLPYTRIFHLYPSHWIVSVCSWKKVDAKHLPQCKRGTLTPLSHNYYGVNVKLLNNMTPWQTMTSDIHHNEEISAARAKVVLGLSISLISFLEVYYHQAEPLTEYSSGVVPEKATAYSQYLDCQASTFSWIKQALSHGWLSWTGGVLLPLQLSLKLLLILCRENTQSLEH